jgi:two-component sensor histidine kinase
MRPIGENEVELVVSDNGVGIPEALELGDAESLGLRLVTMLAEDQLGGQVELDRTEGTRFRIRFGVAE